VAKVWRVSSAHLEFDFVIFYTGRPFGFAVLAGEKIWQQPLEHSYFAKHVKSAISDLKNYPVSVPR